MLSLGHLGSGWETTYNTVWGVHFFGTAFKPCPAARMKIQPPLRIGSNYNYAGGWLFNQDSVLGLTCTVGEY